MIVERVLPRLPTGTSLMVIGGGLMMEHGVPGAIKTKDEDLVLLVVADAQYHVAEVPVVESLIRDLGAIPRIRKDRTSLACQLVTSEGRYLLEFVRGRRGGGGYFISRHLLEIIATSAIRRDRLLIPQLESLAVLKAWAAVDKEKLVKSGRDGRGYHGRRAAGFHADVAQIRQRVLQDRPPDVVILKRLLDSCSDGRRAAVRKVLQSNGWPV